MAGDLLAAVTDGEGNFTLIWSTARGDWIYGKSWSSQKLERSFRGNDASTIAEEIWFGEIDEPSPPGTLNVERARLLVANPEQVHWLDEETWY